jgi:hypothetical protein
MLKDAFHISLAVQNPNDVNDVFVQQVIDSDGFKSSNRPGAEVLKLRIAGCPMLCVFVVCKAWGFRLNSISKPKPKPGR